MHDEKLILFDKKIEEKWKTLLRIKMKEKWKIYNRLDYLVTYNLSRLKKRTKQLLEFFNNSTYKNYLIEKLIEKK